MKTVNRFFDSHLKTTHVVHDFRFSTADLARHLPKLIPSYRKWSRPYFPSTLIKFGRRASKHILSVLNGDSPVQARERWSSKGSKEPPLEVNDGGLKSQAVDFQLVANSEGIENKL